jgi:hypothetical protein
VKQAVLKLPAPIFSPLIAGQFFALVLALLLLALPLKADAGVKGWYSGTTAAPNGPAG